MDADPKSTAPDVDAETRLLTLLLRARAPMTLESIGRSLGCSAVEAAVRLEAIQNRGSIIERHPQQGVQLIRTAITCWSTYIETRHAGRIGRQLSVYRETTSTQELARRLVRTSGRRHDGHVLVTDHQTAGRGRLDRRWTTPPHAALLFTAIIDHRDATLDRLMLAACTTVAEVVESLIGVGTQIRWPNDILIDGKKLAGILVETVGPVALIGIGVNVTAAPKPGKQVELRSPATSLADHAPPVDRLLLLDHLLHHLRRALYDRPVNDLHQAWHDRAALLQQRVTVVTEGRRLTGRVIDLDPADGLLLQLDRGQVVTLPARTTSLALDG